MKINKKRGFTLLELMIVIAIISILAVVLIPNFVNARNVAKLTACQAILKNISSAVEIYSSNNQERYPANDFTVTLSGNPLEEYIGKDYRCPVAKEYYEYKSSNNGSSYYIYCPTYNTSIKHKNNRGTVSKVFFSPQEGVVINY